MAARKLGGRRSPTRLATSPGRNVSAKAVSVMKTAGNTPRQTAINASTASRSRMPFNTMAEVPGIQYLPFPPALSILAGWHPI